LCLLTEDNDNPDYHQVLANKNNNKAFNFLSVLKKISWNDEEEDEDDEVRFVLDQHAELDFYSASSLKQQSVGRHVPPFGHITLI
jgi:hypothetical protein